MKKTFLILSAMVITFYIHAQGYITLSIGGNIPVGVFASTNAASQSAGFAKPGASFDLSACNILWKKFGFMSNARVQVSGYNEKTSGQTATNWQSIFLVIGPYYEFSFGEKLKLDIKAEGGFCRAKPPAINRNDKYYPVITSVGVIGATLRKDISSELAVSFTVDLVSLTPTFTSKSISYTDLEQPMSCINTLIGISYNLNRK